MRGAARYNRDRIQHGIFRWQAGSQIGRFHGTRGDDNGWFSIGNHWLRSRQQAHSMSTDNTFLGRGWSFPPEFSRAAKGVTLLENEQDIESSLDILLSTRLGERIMRPDYGCNLNKIIFENMNLTMQTYLKDLVENAILYHEPRIDLENIEIDTSRETEGLMLIRIDYRVRTTNSRFNYVYPFYRHEGSDLPKLK